MAYKSTEDWLKEYINNTENKNRYNAELATLNASALANKAAIDEAANKDIANLEKSYAEGVTDTRKAVADAREVNAIQRALNERHINERMANLGLSDSGYSDVTRAGNEAAFENTATNLTRNEQKALDTLAATLRENKDALELEREQDKAAVDIKFAEEAAELESDFYKDAEKYASEQKKMQTEAFEAKKTLEENYNKEDEDGKPIWDDEQKEYYLNQFIDKYGAANGISLLHNTGNSAKIYNGWTANDWYDFFSGVRNHTNADFARVLYSKYAKEGIIPSNYQMDAWMGLSRGVTMK